ncbi:MAG: GYD family protein [Acidobacteria bacterium]|nr:MAG: GYD family protein [Acidobacteriota bacterium]
MPNYITLMRYSQKGIETIKDSPKRADAAKKLFESLGGKMKAIYLTMGHYDLVVISEFPNDETAAKALLTTGSQGNVHTQTLRAFTEDEYHKLIASLP